MKFAGYARSLYPFALAAMRPGDLPERLKGLPC